jgi:SAM-dependent methyltransferase
MCRESEVNGSGMAARNEKENNQTRGLAKADFAIDEELLCRISTKYETERGSPLVRWHLVRKFQIMAGLFRAHLRGGCKFLDIGCGEGDCMALARMIEPSCELWGVDINEPSLAVARRRLPRATLQRGDMGNLSSLPQAYFDVVHEFGAAFLMPDWGLLAKSYLSLVRKGGLVLWELPEAMSMAHWMYLLSPAPRNNELDTMPKRIWRSFLPSKITFRSWPTVRRYLETSGFNYRIISRQPFLYFHARGPSHRIVDFYCKRFGCGILEKADRGAKTLFRKSSGYYLVLENLGQCAD